MSKSNKDFASSQIFLDVGRWHVFYFVKYQTVQLAKPLENKLTQKDEVAYILNKEGKILGSCFSVWDGGRPN